jgi:hypothetical protein
MSDRAFVTTLILGGAVVLLMLVWVVADITGSPRSAHEPEIEAVSNQQLAQLSERIDQLSQRLGAGGPGAAGGSGIRTPAAPAPGEILVTWIDQEIPLEDPYAAAWGRATPTTVPLQRQDQTMPVLDEATVLSVTVRALTNGRQIGWHLSWEDARADYHLDTDRFCDAAALQFPLVANAAYTMGAADFPVQLIQWKAIWQKDIDEHFQDVQDLHPNYWADLYWFAEGEFPFPVPDAFQRTESHDWFITFKAGNPMADFYRRQPVQEMFAEGYGSSTVQIDSASVGRGTWRDGRWSIVFARPMETHDPADYQFLPGARDVVAFAIWEGSVENVGARKQHSQWTVFEVQQ